MKRFVFLLIKLSFLFSINTKRSIFIYPCDTWTKILKFCYDPVNFEDCRIFCVDEIARDHQLKYFESFYMIFYFLIHNLHPAKFDNFFIDPHVDLSWMSF